MAIESHNPDVLSCLANLSNDEVFTPPKVVNDMLDLLPPELFKSKETTFLDIGCKSGVFLREIAKRLIAGLADEIPDLQTRVDHVLHRQLFGIATTELTSLVSRRTLYCSKYPNCVYSASRFDTAEGNIRFRNIPHTFVNGRCKWCGASEDQFGTKARKDLESHAYEFIHTAKPEEIFNMKFDVIVGNPPYQLSDGGGTGTSARAIYQLFVEKAIKLSPKYLVMIIPSRWYSGGKGLDEFREFMLTDGRVRKLVDYNNFKDVFPGVDLAGGACYFLWERDNKGDCLVVNFKEHKQDSVARKLNAYPVFIRSNLAVGIVDRIVLNAKGATLDKKVSARLPFGIPTTYQPTKKGVPCYFTQRVGIAYVKKEDVDDAFGYLSKWKFLIPKAPIAGQTDFSKPVGFYYDGNTRIAAPGECCSESWLVATASDSRKEVESFKSYLFTKVVRFLLLQTVVSQNITRRNFCFVPDLGHYDGEYTDQMLCERWGITADEWKFIDSRIS